MIADEKQLLWTWQSRSVGRKHAHTYTVSLEYSLCRAAQAGQTNT